MMKNNFYIYIHVKPHNGEIFYVGKGRNGRAYDKCGRNRFWKNIVKKYGYDVFFLENNLTEDEAFDLEKKYIERVGRRDLNAGTLVNMTDGGEGLAGHIFSEEHKKNLSEATKGKKNAKGHKHSEEAKRKMSEAAKKRNESEEYIKKLSEAAIGKKGPKHTEEAKRKISKTLKGRTFSEETRRKMSEAAKNRKKVSDETRRKLSEAAKKRYAKIK